jgi:pantothenate kinase
MAAMQDGAYLAHISDTVTSIAGHLQAHKQAQQEMLAVLGALLEVNQAQSEMLADIMAAASADTGPSPVAQALEALTARIEALDENQASLMASVADLPEAVGRQFAISLKDWPATDAAPH